MGSFILDTLSSKEAFQFVSLTPESVFATLLWLNPNNFEGFRVWNAELIDQPAAIKVDPIFGIPKIGGNCGAMGAGGDSAGNTAELLRGRRGRVDSATRGKPRENPAENGGKPGAERRNRAAGGRIRAEFGAEHNSSGLASHGTQSKKSPDFCHRYRNSIR